jgi:hypothetical protein
MANQNEIIIISLEELPPEQPADIVINLDELPLESPKIPNVLADIVLEIPDVPCAICHQPINPGESFGTCKVCNTPYHQECWEYNGGCAVLNCSGVRNRRAFRFAMSP